MTTDTFTPAPHQVNLPTEDASVVVAKRGRRGVTARAELAMLLGVAAVATPWSAGLLDFSEDVKESKTVTERDHEALLKAEQKRDRKRAKHAAKNI